MLPCRADQAVVVSQKVAFVAGDAGARATGRWLPICAAARASLARCGGGVEFVTSVAGGTGVGAVGGASGARGGGAVGAGAGAGGGDLGRVDPVGSEADLGRPRAAERLGKGVFLRKHCEKWGERERERDREKGGGRVSDMDKVGNKEDDRQEGGHHSLPLMSVTLDTSQSPKG